MMKRKELCYAKITGKWRLAIFIDSYNYKNANRVQVGDDEWIVKRDEVCTFAEHLEIVKSEFVEANQKLVDAFRANEKPIKAKIAREIGMTIGTLYSRLKKASDLGVDMTYQKRSTA